jgi:hypothetical protein
MKFDENNENFKLRAKPRRAAHGATRSFARSLAEWISVGAPGPTAPARQSCRPQTLARDIVRRRSEVRGADPLSFLSSLFGNRFASVQTRGLCGDRVYKHPGQFFRNTSYNSVTELYMSFDFNQLARNVQILLTQIRTTQIFVSAGSTAIANEPAASRERGERPQTPKFTLVTRGSDAMHWPEARLWSATRQRPEARPRSATVQSRPTMHLPQPMRRSEARQPSEARQRSDAMRWPATLQWLHASPWSQTSQPQSAMQWSPTMQLLRLVQPMHSPQTMLSPRLAQLPHSVRLQPLVRPAREVLVRFPSSPARLGDIEVHEVERRFTLTKLESWDPERTQRSQRSAARSQAMISNVSDQTLVQTTYVRYLGDKSLQPYISLERSNDRSLPFAQQRSRKDARLALETQSGLLPRTRLKQMNARPRSVDPGFAFIPQSLLRTLTKRTTWLTERSQFQTSLFETGLLKTRRFETKRFKQAAMAPVTAEVSRNLLSAAKLILVRKEGAAPAPSIDFVFAQRARQKVTEEHVLKRLEQREIIELVRKEVKQSMARLSPLSDFTREDYVDISDHVYSTLMKRLTVERERLGLR